MIKSNTSRVLFASLIFAVVVIRVALYLKLIRPESVELLENNELFSRLVKLFAICIPFFLLWKRYEYCQRYNKLPGFKTNFGILGNMKIVLSSIKRVKNEGVAISEMSQAISTLSARCSPKGLFVFWVGPLPIVYVSSPDFLRIMMNDHSDLPKGQFYDMLRLVMGEGILTSSGDHWLYHRKLLTPSFNFKVLESFMPNLRKNVKVLISKLEEEASSHPERMIADLPQYIFPCTLDVLCESSMGINVRAQEEPNSDFTYSFHKLLEGFCRIVLQPSQWINKFEWAHPLNKVGREWSLHLKKFLDKSNQAIEEQFDLFRKNSAFYSDPNNNAKEPFINALFREHIQRPKEFPMTAVRDEVNTFMATGHDTVGWALTYLFFMVGHHPEVQARVHEEVDNFFTNFSSEEDIQIDSLKELKYTEAVIRETLRLYPPAPLVARKANRDVKVGPHVIPSGAQIALGITQVHRDPEYWAEPARFKPERFLDSKLSHPYAYVPFSAGPRNCIGQRYAMVQVKSMFAFVMKQYTVQSVDPIDAVSTFGVPVAVADRPIRIKLLKRE